MILTEHDPKQLDKQIARLQRQVDEQQDLIAQLNGVIDAYQKSTSWRISKPVRDLDLLKNQLIRLFKFYNNYRDTYPNTSGYLRLLHKSIRAVLTGGSKTLRQDIVISEKVMLAKFLFANPLAPENVGVHKLDLLNTSLKIGLVLRPTILFDHNGGGGANVYTSALITTIIAKGESVLRIYPFNHVWFIQWVGKNGTILFKTALIEDVFNALSLSDGTCIIINSLYGHPDINVSTAHIINLARNLGAPLDFKINDFNALCPSPHLLDFKGRYCGVPTDADTCKNCLSKSPDWYHAWYPDENKAMDINAWRKPFEALLTAADTITFFDSSSIDIMRRAFYIEGSKVSLAPPNSNYFNCQKDIDLSASLHIGILGHLTEIKGGDVIKELHEHTKTQMIDIPITVVGSTNVNISPNIHVHGEYKPNDLPDIISQQGINIIFIASIVPETFSYTVSEAMKMKLPIVAFDLGAQGARVKQYKLGKVVPLGSSPEEILTAMQAILKFAQEQND